jgi:hypothetical protein
MPLATTKIKRLAKSEFMHIVGFAIAIKRLLFFWNWNIANVNIKLLYEAIILHYQKELPDEIRKAS